ncbi:MAG: CoA-binding protein [Bacillota bacterium]
MSILVDENTKVVIQGITGREGSVAARLMINYGTKVVAGVTPGKGGQMVEGVPVYNSIRSAMKDHEINAALVYVPPAAAKDSILEAVDAGIPLVVVVTERIPIHDSSEALTVARKSGVRVIGPNTLGVISPGKAKIGTIGGSKEARCFQPGTVGVLSRSGGMTTETAWMIKRAGFGCSTCIGIGGDALIGSSFKDLLELFQADPDTNAVVMFCEPGTSYEEEAAEFIRSGGFTKPVIAYVAGRFIDQMPKGAKFGHAGAILEHGAGTAANKIEAFKRVGVLVADEYDNIIYLLQEALKDK